MRLSHRVGCCRHSLQENPRDPETLRIPTANPITTPIEPAKASSRPALPPLENGDRLTREEFERRYDAMPGLKKAELIEGEVYMPSPVRHGSHSEPHTWLVLWLALYRAHTSGVEAGDNGSVRLDENNEPQPDAYLLILPDRGGQSRISEDDYIEGAPELVAEVASTSASFDLGKKLDAYRKNGVREYIVCRVLDRKLDWFVNREGRFELMSPTADDVLRSTVFPGLWLDPIALINGDFMALNATLHKGLESAEHAAFVASPKR